MRCLTTLLMFGLGSASSIAFDGPYLGNGIKVGEASQTSAVVWVRLTNAPEANFGLLKIFTEGLPSNAKSKLPMPTDVLPGHAGMVRLRYGAEGEKEIATDWATVDPSNDFIQQFQLFALKPGTTYDVVCEARSGSSADITSRAEGRFQTAPLVGDSAPIRFIVSTCQAVRSIDSGTQGHRAYKQMLEFKPNFFVHTGDILYYDKVPLAKNQEQARAKWNLMFAYGHNRKFHGLVTSYFMKDDHDTLKNDCWPGQSYGDLQFQQGLDIFREQVCMGEKTYRTVRWGRDVQIWMTENRDFRSSNRDPDGPDKTILGTEQKQWLKRTLSESDATFKFVISPGPVVGPDKRGKKDNHANDVFAHEGQELRDFLSQLKNTYVICGDRHWQYCSKDPQTGLLELGCGPINDEHDFGGAPGNKPKFHRYFGSRGGFLGITVSGDKAKAEWFSANEPVTASGLPKVLHTESLPLSAGE